MSRVRTTSLSALLAAAALILSACGGGTDTATSPAAPAATTPVTSSTSASGVATASASGSGTVSSSAPASSSSAATGTASVEVGDTMDAVELSKQVAAATKAAKTIHAEITGDAAAGDMSLQMDTTTMDMSMTGESDGEKFSFLKVGDAIYLGGMPDMPGGKKWLQMGGSEDDPMSAILRPLMEMMTKLTDVSSFTAIEGVTAKVVAVDGDQVTWETKMTSDQIEEMTKKLLKDMDLPSSSGTSAIVSGDVTVRQTVDSRNLPVRVEMITDKDGTQETMNMTYSKWGEPVDITAPPASEVATFKDLMGGISTGG